jgi:uncharacterized protein YbcI
LRATLDARKTSEAGFMPGTESGVALEGTPVRSLSAAISNAVVGLLHDYTGRGPTKVRTTITPDAILVTLRDSLTKAERTLAARGRSGEVLSMRRAFQDTMRVDLITAVEALTGRTVEAFLSDNLHDPDVAVEIFLLNPDKAPSLHPA